MPINMFPRGVVLSSDYRDGRGCISATVFTLGMGVKFAKVTPLRFPGDPAGATGHYSGPRKM